MIKSIANINALLIDIKTINNLLSIKLQQAGFNLNHELGSEDEYTVSSLLNSIDTLAVQFLTITANRNQFIQRTSYIERQQIESYLRKLFVCLKQTQNALTILKGSDYQIIDNKALSYMSDAGEATQLLLTRTIEYIDLLKPFTRMLELIIAQERIHALSSVLETLLSKESGTTPVRQDEDDLTDEQNNALELSHYLIKQAL
jgi:hypothetical protein